MLGSTLGLVHKLWRWELVTAGESMESGLIRDLMFTSSMSLRPLLKKGLTIRSNQTGRIQDIVDALELSVAGKVTSKVEVLQLVQLNEALDRVKSGNVVGKLVVDLT